VGVPNLSGGSQQSYVKFDTNGSQDGLEGGLTILPAKAIPNNLGYWHCPGQGWWEVTDANTITIYFPKPCPNASQAYTFDEFYPPPTTGFGNDVPPAATLMTAIWNPEMYWFRFPDLQCNAAFTECTAPYP
jgi:hypothetical protein